MYTSEQVKEIVKKACAYQKFVDYQMAGEILIKDEAVNDEDVEALLNNLCDIDNNAASGVEY